MARGSTEISKEILPIELNSHFYHIDTSIKEMGIVIYLSKVSLTSYIQVNIYNYFYICSNFDS